LDPSGAADNATVVMFAACAGSFAGASANARWAAIVSARLDWYLSSGALAKAVAMTSSKPSGSPGIRAVGRGGGRCKCPCMAAATESPGYGTDPVRSLYSTQPRL
jgi:hypothetical protein